MGRIRIRKGRVTGILSRRKDCWEVEVVLADGAKKEKAICYPDLTGPVREGEEVLLNTTACHLNLGSGGYHFIIASLDGDGSLDLDGPGHIMKLRYTPFQLKCLAVEEEASPHHQVIKKARDARGLVVVAAPLHSMLAVVAAVVARSLPGCRVAYVMTDGAALPISFSRTVTELKEKGLLCGTVTVGHAFGGDLEAVNVYSGLLAARHVLAAQVAVVGMGPGIVGTGTPYGFTGIEQGQVINAAATLQSRPVAVPRLSFADPRPRHHGLSHHTLTALGKVALSPCYLPLPVLKGEKKELVFRQLEEAGLHRQHQVVEIEAEEITAEALAFYGLRVSTMGRGWQEDKEYFLACGAAGILAARLVEMEADKVR